MAALSVETTALCWGSPKGDSRVAKTVASSAAAMAVMWVFGKVATLEYCLAESTENLKAVQLGQSWVKRTAA